MSGNKSVFAQAVDRHKNGEAYTLGPYASLDLVGDPRHLFIALARYKFCSKMLAGRQRVLEVGCGDGLGLELILQTCSKVTAIDLEPAIIQYNQEHNRYPDRLEFEARDIIARPYQAEFDAALSLDVLEHIAPEQENDFLRHLGQSLQQQAPCLIGTPNITASAYASEGSRREHINLKSHETLLASLTPHFHNIFIFSMNDELVHTGFYPMAHYLMALAVGPKHPAE